MNKNQAVLTDGCAAWCSKKWRGAGVAGAVILLSLEAAGFGAATPPGRLPPPPAPTVHVRYVNVDASPRVSAELTGSTVIRWLSPLGTRIEYSNRLIINPAHRPFHYELNTMTKRARRVPNEAEMHPNPESPFDKELQQGLGAFEKSAHTRVTGHITFLGYPCTIKETDFSVGKENISEVDWDATVGGYPVTLRSATRIPGGKVLLVEALEVKVMAKTPPTLFHLPPGYVMLEPD